MTGDTPPPDKKMFKSEQQCNNGHGTYDERWSDPVESVLGHAVGHQEDECVDDGGAVDCGHDGEPHPQLGSIFLNMVG